MINMEDFLKQIILEAGALAKDYFLKGVSFKSKAHLGDLVTEADVAVSDFLIKKIHEQYPEHAIYTEEAKDKINPGAEFEWIIDPIDGTRNFAKGIGMWCVMIAVYKNNMPVLAAIYNPLASELFFAVKGKGATMNGAPIKVNQVEVFDHAFGFAVRGIVIDPLREANYRRFIEKLTNETSAWMHNFGTILAACYVASGGADFYAVNCGRDYDYAAVVLIAAEAGAVVTNADGQPWTRDRNDIVIANPKLHAKILELLK